MRSIKIRFNNIKNNNPSLSDYACFAEAIKGQKFTERSITENFNRLVDKKDYLPSEKKEILSCLYCLNEDVQGYLIYIRRGKLMKKYGLIVYIAEAVRKQSSIKKWFDETDDGNSLKIKIKKILKELEASIY